MEVKAKTDGNYCDGGGLWLVKCEGGGGKWVLARPPRFPSTMLHYGGQVAQIATSASRGLPPWAGFERKPQDLDGPRRHGERLMVTWRLAVRCAATEMAFGSRVAAPVT